MKKQLIYLIVLCVFGSVTESKSQDHFDISFESKTIKVSKSSKHSITYPIVIKSKNASSKTWKNHFLTVVVNSAKSTLPSSEYKIDFTEKEITTLNQEQTVYLTLPKDTLTDRERKLYLTLQITNKTQKNISDKNSGSITETVVIVEAHNKADDQPQETFDISFENKAMKVAKSDSKMEIYPIIIKTKRNKSESWKKHVLSIGIDTLKSTLPPNDYSIDFNSKELNHLNSEETLYLKLPKDTLSDRERKLYLNLNVRNNGKKLVNEKNAASAENKTIEITVNAHKRAENQLSHYSNLTYVGTNFDLVDKVKAENFFFATNIFIPPVENKNKLGFYLSLYGNRAMSDVDSTGIVRRTYKLESVNDSTYIRHTEQAKMITTRVSDNIGAHINLLVSLFPKKEGSDLSLYYSPSLEFVWRRTKISRLYKNPTLRDSIVVTGSIPGTIELDSFSQRNYNEFSFNAGALGLFLALENKTISVRAHASVGYSSNFYPQLSMSTNQINTKRSNDIFFSGRVWITEPITGITLQAEITNTAINSRPFFGATLSKAFHFKDIGGFFSPLIPSAKK